MAKRKARADAGIYSEDRDRLRQIAAHQKQIDRLRAQEGGRKCPKCGKVHGRRLPNNFAQAQRSRRKMAQIMGHLGAEASRMNRAAEKEALKAIAALEKKQIACVDAREEVIFRPAYRSKRTGRFMAPPGECSSPEVLEETLSVARRRYADMQAQKAARKVAREKRAAEREAARAGRRRNPRSSQIDTRGATVIYPELHAIAARKTRSGQVYEHKFRPGTRVLGLKNGGVYIPPG
jgi:hypothetical protein